MVRFDYPQLSAIELLKSASFFNAIATQFELDTQKAIIHCCGIFGNGADPNSFVAEGDFLACLRKLIRMQATEIKYSKQYNQFFYSINGRPDFRVLKGGKFTPNASLVPAALAGPFIQGMMEFNNTTTEARTTTPELAFVDSAFASANSSAPASPTKNSNLSPTAAEFRATPPSLATAAYPSPTTMTKKVAIPEQPCKIEKKLRLSDRAQLLKNLDNVQLTHFTEYRNDPDYYRHMCSTLFPDEAPDNTTDTPALLAQWRRELGI